VKSLQKNAEGVGGLKQYHKFGFIFKGQMWLVKVHEIVG